MGIRSPDRNLRQARSKVFLNARPVAEAEEELFMLTLFAFPTPLSCGYGNALSSSLRNAYTRRNSPMACAAPTPFSMAPARRIDIVSVPMTAGGDVLFPGGSQVLTISTADALRASEANNSQFGYLPVDAWGEPSTVGTIAVVDEFEAHGTNGTALVLCTGLERFRVVSLDDDSTFGTVKCFCDDPTPEEYLPEVMQQEEKLVKAMTEIVRLSIKISNESDERRQKALAETLKRVDAFCAPDEGNASENLLHHWILELDPNRRREILTFIVMDLLSLSFMSRRSLMLETDTQARLETALHALVPFLKELAAKGAIVSALGKKGDDK